MRHHSLLSLALVALTLVAGCGGSGGGGSTLPESQPAPPLPIEAVRAAAEAAPEDPTRQLALLDAELHDEGGDPTRWAAVAERVERLAPGNPRAHLMVARVAYLHGEPERSAEHYLRAIESAAVTAGSAAIAEVAASSLGDMGTLAPQHAHDGGRARRRHPREPRAHRWCHGVVAVRHAHQLRLSRWRPGACASAGGRHGLHHVLPCGRPLWPGSHDGLRPLLPRGGRWPAGRHLRPRASSRSAAHAGARGARVRGVHRRERRAQRPGYQLRGGLRGGAPQR
jgi:hypothetical protein